MKFSHQFSGLLLQGAQVITPPTLNSRHLASSIPHAPGWLWTSPAAPSYWPRSPSTVHPPNTGNFRTLSLNLFYFLICILHELLLELSIYNTYSPNFSDLKTHVFNCPFNISFWISNRHLILNIPQTLKILSVHLPKPGTLFYITSMQLSK